MILTKENKLLYAIKFYSNPQSSTVEDFLDDFKLFTQIDRLLTRYRNKNNVSIHLMLNQIVIVYNLFGDGANELLFTLLKEENKPFIKSFALFLGRITDTDSRYYDIPIDESILNYLIKI